MNFSFRRLLSIGLGVAALAAPAGLVLSAAPPQAVATWAPLGHFAQARTGAASVALDDGRTLVTGGRVADGTVTDTVDAFNPVTGELTTLGRLLAARVGHSATLLTNGQILIVGGSVDNVVSADVEIFDPASGSSSLAARMAQPRTRHTAARLLDGQVLIAGGNTPVASAGGTPTYQALVSAELFDPETNTMMPAPGQMTEARAGASATALIDGRVLIAGGSNAAGDLKSAEIYDPFTPGAFTPTDTELSVARTGHTAILLPHNNSVLIAGGTHGGEAVSTADLFVPSEFPDPFSYGIGRFAPAAPMASPRARANGGPAGDNGYVFVMGGASADAEVYRFATIRTDKSDYAPGERAVITGSGWRPGLAVRLLFQEDPAVHDDYAITLTADGEGNIFYDQWAPEYHDLGVRFYLMATDGASKAQITFTDGPLAYSPASQSLTIASGSSGSFVQTVTSDAPATAAVKTAGLPSGWSVTTSKTPLRFIAPALSDTWTVTVAVPAATAPGSYAFQVKANPSAGGEGSGTAVTVTVTGGPTKLAFTSAPASAVVGQCMGPITIQSQNASNVATNVTGTTNVGLATNQSGAFFDSNSCDQAIASIALATGSNSESFYYRATTRGTGLHQLTLTAVGLTGDSQVETITKATPTVSWLNPADIVYGTTLSGTQLNATASVPGTFTYTPPAGTKLNAGPNQILSVSFAPNDTNSFNAVPSTTVALTVLKANATIDVDGYGGTYDGQAHGATGTATGVNGEALSGLALGASFTNVPGGTAAWTFTDVTGNYNDTAGTVAIVINKANATVNVEGFAGVYDSQAHGATGTATGVNGEALGGLDLGASFTNVPGGTAAWTFTDVTGNYNDTAGTVAIVINKANATVNVEGFAGVYDSQAHGATGTATGVNGEALGGLDFGTSFTNVPGGTAAWTFTDATGNYNDTAGNVAIVIDKAVPTVVAAGGVFTYNGQAHTGTCTVVGIGYDDLGTVTPAYSPGSGAPTNAGDYTVGCTYPGSANYTNAASSAPLKINKADQVINWEAPGPIVYGTALSIVQLKATLAAGDGALTYTPAAGTVLEVGIRTLRVDAAETANYKAAMKTVAITITPWYLKGFYQPVTMGHTGLPIVWNTVKGGSTVPLKFNLYSSENGVELTSVADVKGFSVLRVGCSTGVEDAVDVFSTTGGTSLRYDGTDRQFIQNWQTIKGAGACYQVTMTARDGSAITAFFKAK